MTKPVDGFANVSQAVTVCDLDEKDLADVVPRESSPSLSASSLSACTPLPLSETDIAMHTTSASSDIGIPGTKLRSRAQAIGLIALVTCTMSMSAAGSTSLNIALPTIQKDLGILEVDLQWVMSGFNLSSACLMLLSGKIADLYGRKLCFLFGMAYFGLLTLGAAFVRTGTELIVIRALSGIGVAIGIPSSMGIIAANFEGSWRTTAFAMFAAGAPIGGGTGSVLGGFLTAYSPASWRTTMWIFAGIALLIFATGILVVPSDGPRPTDKRIDWVGAVLVTAGLICLQFVISQSSTASRGWKTNYIIALFVLSICALIGFFVWEHILETRTSRPPLMRLALWTRAKGKLAVMYFVGFTAWMGFTSAGYHTALLYQQVMLTGVTGAVWRSIPASICGLLCNIVIAKIVARVRTQWVVCIGLASTGTASIFFALSGRYTLYWGLPFNGMWLNVVGADFVMSTSMIFVSALALPEEQSVAGALFQTLIQLGGSIGLALTSAIAQAQQSKALESGAAEIDAISEGLHAAFYLGAAFTYVACCIGIVMLRGLGIVARPQAPVTAITHPPAARNPDSISQNGRATSSSHNSVDKETEADGNINAAIDDRTI